MALITVHTSPLARLGGKDAGGLNVHVRDLALQLGQCGVAVDVFTRRIDPFTPEVCELTGNVNVVSIAAGAAEPLPKEELFPLLPDFASEVALYSLRHGIRYDIIHSHYWLSGWVGHLLTRYWSAPTVHTFHTLARLKNEVSAPDAYETRVRLRTEQRLLQVLDNIIAPNPDERAEMVWRMGADNSKICVIPPGVDLTRFQPDDAREARRRLRLPDGPLVLFVGRIDPMKGVDTLLDGFAHLLRTGCSEEIPHLVFIGGSFIPTSAGLRPGDDLRPVVERAEALGIADRVLFRGSEPQELLPDYYAASTVCAVPSRYESFGLVAVEAMACGLPVVASRAGGLKFTVEEERSGLLVPPGDPAALAEALDRVIDDHDLRASLRVGARQAAIRFSWQTIGPAMVSLYERLAEGERENLCCLGEIYAS